jgi:histidine triad (HIT) family protein
MTADTIFDRILRKEIPASIVYEDESVVAFKDVNPQAPVHVLVVPRHKLQRFSDLKEQPLAQVGELFAGAARVAAKLGLERDGYRIVVNNGRHGQQSVDYIHVHILGGRQLEWPPG